MRKRIELRGKGPETVPWVEHLKRTAAEMAAEGFPVEIQDGDDIEVDCVWEPGAYAGSEHTGPDPDTFSFEVTVKRGGVQVLDRLYTDKEAEEFFMELMRRGSRGP